jgi:hypothetical protein
MHKALFNLVTYGKGGWSYEVAYNLPVYLRRFYMEQLVEVLKRETEAATPKSAKKTTPRGQNRAKP